MTVNRLNSFILTVQAHDAKALKENLRMQAPHFSFSIMS